MKLSEGLKWGIAIGMGMLIIKVAPHIYDWWNQAPLQRCKSSKALPIDKAEDECLAELGMEPASVQKGKVANPLQQQARTQVWWIVSACDQADEGEEFARGFCDGFIEGAYTGIKEWCVPSEVTRGQLQELVIAELQILKEGGGRTMLANEAISTIISRRWPCE